MSRAQGEGRRRKLRTQGAAWQRGLRQQAIDADRQARADDRADAALGLETRKAEHGMDLGTKQFGLSKTCCSRESQGSEENFQTRCRRQEDRSRRGSRDPEGRTHCRHCCTRTEDRTPSCRTQTHQKGLTGMNIAQREKDRKSKETFQGKGLSQQRELAGLARADAKICRRSESPCQSSGKV